MFQADDLLLPIVFLLLHHPHEQSDEFRLITDPSLLQPPYAHSVEFLLRLFVAICHTFKLTSSYRPQAQRYDGHRPGNHVCLWSSVCCRRLFVDTSSTCARTLSMPLRQKPSPIACSRIYCSQMGGDLCWRSVLFLARVSCLSSAIDSLSILWYG